MATDTVIRELRAYLDDIAAADAFSGAVLIAKGDEPLFTGAYGLASKGFGIPNTVETKFNLGSMYCLQVKVLSHMSSTRISAARGGKGSVAAYTPYVHEPFAPTHGCRYAMRLMRLCHMAAVRLA